MAPVARLEKRRALDGPPGEDVDDAAERPVAPHARPPAVDDLDLLDRLERDPIPVHQPPNGSLIGTPSSSTRARLVPLRAMPRSERPCVVGCPTAPDVRRNRVKVGTCRRGSSTGWLADWRTSSRLMTGTLAGGAPPRPPSP